MVTAPKKKSSALTAKVKIINKLGLHLRAAAVFIKAASAFQAEISLRYGGKRVNGKSIMGVMALAAPVGSELTIQAKGPDAKQALEELVKLVSDRFGEPE